MNDDQRKFVRDLLRLMLFVGVAVATAFRLSADEVAAKKPDADETWWSLKPLNRPLAPRVEKTFAHFQPVSLIDHFVLATLIEKGLEPSPPADKRTLMRRVYLDLIGLPPTPEALEEFLADDQPEAFERLVDQLLASPQYGERWARHWMDVAHYAETHGHDQDRPRPNAWPYRDYLIRAFNDDTPYARFVQEQIAGDVLFPDDPQAIVATGFLATGPWDESSLQSIRDDTDDRKIAQYLDRDDIVTTVMSTFVSATAHCARCHDHFFDPITQADHYALQAVFAGVDKADRPYDPNPHVAHRRRELQQEMVRWNSLKGKSDASLLTAEVQQAVAVWEARRAAMPLAWQVLEATEAKSANGAILTKQSDGSILASDKRPETDTYTLTFATTLTDITGLRLEVLTDDSLAHRGPGRQDNGNLHLSEIKIFAAPAGEARESGNAEAVKKESNESRPVELKNPKADFNQEGWTITHALDGNKGTAWGIHPEVGRDHRAAFEIAPPISHPDGTVLTVVLEQLHGGGHLIGRARVSVTTAPAPLPLESDLLPPEIVDALKIPANERSELQRATLARFVLIQQTERALALLPPIQMVYAAASLVPAQATLRPVHILERGNIAQPKEPAVTGALSALTALPGRFELPNPNDEGSRRAALARWLSDERNVLTWRSIANRVWHYHIGRGLVDTPNDFGHMGSRPTHPELLDWLACELIASALVAEPTSATHAPAKREENGVDPATRAGATPSLKRLHRLIVTSAAYRQASSHDDRWAEIDGDNRYLWRANRTRLDAESVRDAILLVTGKLDPTMGGPSAKQFIQTPGIHVTPNVDYANFDPDRPENFRRSVYRFVFRTLPDPFMDSMDCPDASQWTPVRNTSVTALQALSMLNNKFVVRQSEHLALRASGANGDTDRQIAEAFRRVLLRQPTDTERRRLAEYARQYGMANACRVLFNSNEFLFVD